MLEILLFLGLILLVFLSNSSFIEVGKLPAIDHLTEQEKKEIDFIDLADGDFTGNTTAAQDRINLADLEFDDDEIILFLGAFPWKETLDSNHMATTTVQNGFVFSVTLFQCATAAVILPADIMICQAGFWGGVNATATGPGYSIYEPVNIQPQVPVPIFSHFFIQNFVELAGIDASTVVNWRFYFVRKKVPKSLAEFIRLLRMQDL